MNPYSAMRFTDAESGGTFIPRAGVRWRNARLRAQRQRKDTGRTIPCFSWRRHKYIARSERSRRGPFGGRQFAAKRMHATKPTDGSRVGAQAHLTTHKWVRSPFGRWSA